MAASLSNTKPSTVVTLEQAQEPNFELSKERIQLAFSPSSVQSSSANSNDGNQHVVSLFNSEPVARGVRWSPPETAQRLIGFVTEHRWQGHILKIDAETFWARVFEINNPNAVDEIEEVEFGIDEVPDLMRHLIVPGGIFNWDIGFQVEPSGQRVRQSILQFPMIPTFTENDRKHAAERAKKRFSSLGWDLHGEPAQPKDASAV
jgi:hypothetical protein